jgi:flagellar hook-length control protein FliK
VGATDLKSLPDKQAKDFKGSGSDSFGKALEEKISSNAPKEQKAPIEKKPEVRSKDSPRAEKKEDEVTSKPQAKTEQKVEAKNGKTENKDKPDRQKAIKEFMDSFESEFEIPPTRLVEAMASLDESQLVKTPEDTAEAVIGQLGLDEQDQDKAQAMYVGLLMQLQKTEAAAPAITAATPATASVQNVFASAPAEAKLRMSAAQARQDGMEASVDRLNQHFWMRDAGAKAPDAGLQQNMSLDERLSQIAAKAEDLGQATQQQQLPAKALPELPPHLQGQMNENISPQLLAMLAAKQAAAQQQAAGGESAELSEEDQELIQQFDASMEGMPQVKMAEKPAMGIAMAAQQQANGQSAQEDAQSQTQSHMQGQHDLTGEGKAPTKEAAKSKLTAKAAEFKTSLIGAEGMAVAPKLESLKSEMGMPIAAAPAPVVAKADHEAAVKNLMNQAQYLIKRGGGEMKVQMTPEGMGTIHLKMQIQDGKVNVQMQADTPEAKKTIESGLAELKTSLAAHKLSVDHIKVDMVTGPNTDTAMNNHNNLNGNSQRDQTRQFWNQFNENFGSQGRQNAFVTEPTSLRGYSGQRDPLQAVEASSVKPRSTEGKGSGLNLVV